MLQGRELNSRGRGGESQAMSTSAAQLCAPDFFCPPPGTSPTGLMKNATRAPGTTAEASSKELGNCLELSATAHTFPPEMQLHNPGNTAVPWSVPHRTPGE